MDGGDRLHRIILREYRNNQLLNEASWAQKAVDESRVPQPNGKRPNWRTGQLT